MTEAFLQLKYLLQEHLYEKFYLMFASQKIFQCVLRSAIIQSCLVLALLFDRESFLLSNQHIPQINNMKTLSEVIADEYKKCNLKDLYKVKVPAKCPIGFPMSDEFDKQIFLKKELKTVLETNYKDTALWIIQKWGGVRSYSNVNKLFDLRCTVCNKNPLSMDCVSSLSKVASFLDPENYAVYDSRVVYTLNWFIFSNGLNDKFFFQPRGQSHKIRKEDQDKIFNAVLKKVCYLDKDECYAKYIEVLKGASKLLGGIEIYKIEMFLFAIAPLQIYNQVQACLSCLTKPTKTNPCPCF
jgi:hypothetical protein